MTTGFSNLLSGGVAKNLAGSIEFNTDSIPDIHDNTIIVGVCGIFGDASDPVEDGWFLSDFFAFNYLLRGLGHSQYWLTAEHPQDLVKSYGEYVHGSQNCDRKVVLSQDLLDRREITHCMVFPATDLLSMFLDCLKHVGNEARKSNCTVVVFLFGHGDKDTRGVCLGPVVDSDMYHLTTDKFHGAIGQNVSVTLVSTACFSGGWSVNQFFNATAPTAAGTEEESEPRATTGSLGRLYGLLYARTLIKSLCAVSTPLIEGNSCERSSNPAGSLQPEEPNEAQKETYTHFCDEIYKTLITGVGRLQYEHKITFNAQDEGRGSASAGRTGLPLQHFARRWENLKTRRPARPVDEMADRNPGSQERLTPDAGGVFGRFGGISPSRADRNYLAGLCRTLVGTCPGIWTLGRNVALGSRLRRFASGEREVWIGPGELISVLEYRFRSMRFADLIVTFLGLPSPSGMRCHRWNGREWGAATYSRLYASFDKYHSPMIKLIREADIFPDPQMSQGPHFSQPTEYIIAAMLEGSQSLDVITRQIETVKEWKDQILEQQKDELVKEPGVRKHGRTWLGTLGCVFP